MLAAVPPARGRRATRWIGAGSSLDDVPEGARVGTASLRRRAQLLAARAGPARSSELHGNVDTRLRKLAEGELDAIVLAVAGLRQAGPRGRGRLRDPGRVDDPCRRPGLPRPYRSQPKTRRLAAAHRFVWPMRPPCAS